VPRFLIASSALSEDSDWRVLPAKATFVAPISMPAVIKAPTSILSSFKIFSFL
jgi:hypothetical protein